jgi:pimeloyl-ACP methyl ester carboxylesterase
MDDRGIGESTGDFSSATSEDFVTDISAGVDFLKARTDIPAEKVGVIGHSEGGMIGPMLAAERDDLAFVVMLAGPGIPITELLAEQKYLIALANGGDEKGLKTQRETDLAFNQLLAKHANSDQYTNQAQKYIKNQMQDQLDNEAQLEAASNGIMKQIDNVWFRFFIAFDPEPYLKKVKAPILAINGTKDLQVAAESNLAGIESTLKKAGHQDFTIMPLENLNHLLQTSDTGSPAEYIKIEQTVEPMALEAMSEWLDTRFK